MTTSSNPLLNATSPLTDITDACIKDFITSNLDENYTVELKMYIKGDKSFSYKIRKAIASFANQQGGFLLVGIKDRKNSKHTTSVNERVQGHEITEEIQKWVDDICGKGLITPRVSYQVSNVTVGIKKVAIIAIKPYQISPVGIKKEGGGMLEFWIRGNGSDVPMDYMDLSRKYQSNHSTLISAAFIDLSDTYRDLDKLFENSLNLNTFNPIQIVSSVVDDRTTLYGLTGYDYKFAGHINTLRRLLPVINKTIDIGNNAHASGKTISNSEELSAQLSGWSKKAAEEVINIMSDLYRIFPEIGYQYMNSLADEYGIKIEI